jgi:hypothetical protein
VAFWRGLWCCGGFKLRLLLQCKVYAWGSLHCARFIPRRAGISLSLSFFLSLFLSPQGTATWTRRTYLRSSARWP